MISKVAIELGYAPRDNKSMLILILFRSEAGERKFARRCWSLLLDIPYPAEHYIHPYWSRALYVSNSPPHRSNFSYLKHHNTNSFLTDSITRPTIGKIHATMSASLPGSRELPASQYDLSTYWGRVQHAAGLSDPR